MLHFFVFTQLIYSLKQRSNNQKLMSYIYLLKFFDKQYKYLFSIRFRFFQRLDTTVQNFVPMHLIKLKT